MGRPVDVVAALVGEGGNLMVIEGRGDVYTYDPGSDEDGPQSFAGAFVRGDKLYVIDSGLKPWVYDPATGVWGEGVTLVEEEAKEPPAGESPEPWKAMGNMGKKAPPEEPTPA
jgi:hypothetical protein